MSPLYAAPRVWVPALNSGTDPDGTTNEARPSGPTGAVPNGVLPSEKATVPVGVANPGAPVTVAVRVTGPPTSGAAEEDDSTTAGLLLPTVSCRLPLLAA